MYANFKSKHIAFWFLLGFGLQSFFGTKLILSVAQSVENCQEPRAGIRCLLRFTTLLDYISFTCTFCFVCLFFVDKQILLGYYMLYMVSILYHNDTSTLILVYLHCYYLNIVVFLTQVNFLRGHNDGLAKTLMNSNVSSVFWGVTRLTLPYDGH